MKQTTTPKIFISYSWTSAEHVSKVIGLAERLVSDGVDVLLDRWDLKEGQDKYAYMEKMVVDPTVSKVLILSDALYAKKADQRKGGVGTESQIISKEIYDKVDQQKFIPIVLQHDQDGMPCLPVFLGARIYLDFSNPKKYHEDYEKLLRLLFNSTKESFVNQVTIKKLNIGDSEEVYYLINSNRNYLGNWLTWVVDTQSRSDTEAFLLKSLELTAERKGYFCGIFVEDILIGVAGSTIYPGEKNSMFLNYWVSERWSRGGLATQACQQLIHFLESEWSIDTFFVTLSENNIASLRVAEKLGFRFSQSLTNSDQNTGSSANLLYKRLKASTYD